MKYFNEIFIDKTKYGVKIQTGEYGKQGKHIIVDQGQNQIAGYTDREDGLFEEVPVIIFGDHTRVIKYIDQPFFLGADGVKVLRSKDGNTDYKYLYYALKNVKIPNTGYNRHFKWLKESKIEYPDIKEQRKIVRILDKVSDIIQNRKRELSQLDDLVRARFVELFGDVKINQHNYKKIKIKQVLKSCEAGWSGNGTQRVKKDDEIAVLKVSAVTKGYFIPEECKVLDDQENIKKYVTPEKGDLLFSRANTREMVGATAIVREDYPTLILPDKLWKIRFNDSANVFYMKYVLSSKSIRNEFSASSTGTSGSMFNVSMDKFKEIEIPIAPIELQNQFADFVQAIDKSKDSVQKALDEAQLLFDSLMQQYFG